MPKEEREAAYTAIELLPFVQAVMHVDGVEAPGAAYGKMRFVVHEEVLAAVGFALRPGVAGASAEYAALWAGRGGAGGGGGGKGAAKMLGLCALREEKEKRGGGGRSERKAGGGEGAGSAAKGSAGEQGAAAAEAAAAAASSPPSPARGKQQSLVQMFAQKLA